MPLVDGKEVEEMNVQPAISNLANREIPRAVAGKIIFVTTTKFLCPFHPMRTVVNMAENPFRHKKYKMTEFECSCGTIYRKK